MITNKLKLNLIIFNTKYLENMEKQNQILDILHDFNCLGNPEKELYIVKIERCFNILDMIIADFNDLNDIEKENYIDKVKESFEQYIMLSNFLKMSNNFNKGYLIIWLNPKSKVKN